VTPIKPICFSSADQLTKLSASEGQSGDELCCPVSATKAGWAESSGDKWWEQQQVHQQGQEQQQKARGAAPLPEQQQRSVAPPPPSPWLQVSAEDLALSSLWESALPSALNPVLSDSVARDMQETVAAALFASSREGSPWPGQQPAGPSIAAAGDGDGSDAKPATTDEPQQQQQQQQQELAQEEPPPSLPKQQQQQPSSDGVQSSGAAALSGITVGFALAGAATPQRSQQHPEQLQREGSSGDVFSPGTIALLQSCSLSDGGSPPAPCALDNGRDRIGSRSQNRTHDDDDGGAPPRFPASRLSSHTDPRSAAPQPAPAPPPRGSSWGAQAAAAAATQAAAGAASPNAHPAAPLTDSLGSGGSSGGSAGLLGSSPRPSSIPIPVPMGSRSGSSSGSARSNALAAERRAAAAEQQQRAAQVAREEEAAMRYQRPEPVHWRRDGRQQQQQRVAQTWQPGGGLAHQAGGGKTAVPAFKPGGLTYLKCSWYNWGGRGRVLTQVGGLRGPSPLL